MPGSLRCCVHSQSCGACCTNSCQHMSHISRKHVWLVAQPELRRVLYPLFIHTFLQLVERGAAAEAAQLMGRHKRRFGEGAPHPSKTRKQAWRRSALQLFAHILTQFALCISLPSMHGVVCYAVPGSMYACHSSAQERAGCKYGAKKPGSCGTRGMVLPCAAGAGRSAGAEQPRAAQNESCRSSGAQHALPRAPEWLCLRAPDRLPAGAPLGAAARAAQ